MRRVDNGFTPLHYAALSNACEVAEVLLKNGADVNAKATLHASISPHYTTFLDKKESDNRELADSTPLHAAALSNAYGVAEVLLKNRADVNAKGDGGDTPLHYAAFANARKSAEVLLKNMADVNAKGNVGRTPLHAAALSNAYEVAEVLLENGAKVKALDSRGFLGNFPKEYADDKTKELLLRYGDS